MVRQGHWLYQHTPNQGVATKPPLVGWISAALFTVTRSWELAWRLPSFAAALILGWVMWRKATTSYGSVAGFFAAAAFGLNLLTPRLATLVRTDMPLALVTFLVGLQIWQKIRRNENWTTRDRMVAFLLLALALLIKGPILYAFILPGLVSYCWIRRKHQRLSAWCGWWPWVFSLAIFLAWVGGGIMIQPGFYENVVLREFLGRFSETVHKPQPLYFYLPHLLHKFAPWSLLLLAIAILFWRRSDTAKMEPATLWLVCWCVGGIVLMSIIPSKRVDRIFPMLPPLCLLLGALISAANKLESLSRNLRPWLGRALVFAVLFTAGYSVWKVSDAYRDDSGALVRFSKQVRDEARENAWRYEVVGGREEGMLLYLQRDRFLAPNEAIARWRNSQLDALVVRDQPPRPWMELLPKARLVLQSGKVDGPSSYSLFVRQP